MAKRNSSAKSTNSNTNASVPLKIQTSRKLPNGEWTSKKIGVAFKSKCGNRLNLVFDRQTILGLEGEIASIWLTPYESKDE